MTEATELANGTPSESSRDLCKSCCGINNFELCGPRMTGSETEIEYNQQRANAVWIGPTLGHIRRTTATCSLCRVIHLHLTSREAALFEGDLERRVGLIFVNQYGRQSDGTQTWHMVAGSDATKTSAGIAAVIVGIEAKPGSCTWRTSPRITHGLRVYAPKNCSPEIARVVMRREIDEAVSESTLATPGKWLDDCINGHWRCRLTLTGPEIDDTKDVSVQLPTRTIAVSKDKWSVRYSAGQRARYIALSYCWGNTGVAKPFQLLKHNINDLEHEQAIDDSVPKTYRDAMFLTQALGFSHLWIDALCIVQDDDADWEREARAMASIYENATVTIAALASQGIHDGLLNRTKPSAIAAIPWLERDDHGESHNTGNILTTADFPVELQVTERTLGESEQEAKASKWVTRGWTFQEAALSRRILYFGRYGSYWECQQIVRSEDEWDEKVTNDPPKADFFRALAASDNLFGWFITELHNLSLQVRNAAAPSIQDTEEIQSRKAKLRIGLALVRPLFWFATSSRILSFTRYLHDYYDKWLEPLDLAGMTYMHKYVADYTARDLTRSSDRLIAFESFAKMFAQRTNQEFHSGIWTKSIAYCMYWCPVPGKSHLLMPTVAPSWSWASRMGPVEFPENDSKNRKLLWLNPRSGDLTRVKFLDRNFRIGPIRGVRPESIELQAISASAVRSQRTCIAYTETRKYLVEILRLKLRSNHSRIWPTAEPHLLFVDCSATTLPGDPRNPAAYECPTCNQDLRALDEYRAIAHIEDCSGNSEISVNHSADHLKLYGLALFDDSTLAPTQFTVLVLSHGKDQGTFWVDRGSVDEAPVGSLGLLQDRILVRSDKSAFGVQWTTRGSGLTEAWRASMETMCVYYLLLVQETETLGHYVRIGIGVGYWLPGAQVFGGVKLDELGPRSSFILV